MVERRPLLAAALSLFYPGLGHVYLREWLRALLWFLLVVSTAMLVVPDSALQVSGLDEILRAQRNLPVEATAALLAVTAFSMLDAYWIASRGSASGDASASGGGAASESDAEGDGDATVRCSECRKSVDTSEYDFCPWCGSDI